MRERLAGPRAAKWKCVACGKKHSGDPFECKRCKGWHDDIVEHRVRYCGGCGEPCEKCGLDHDRSQDAAPPFGLYACIKALGAELKRLRGG